MKLLHFRKLLRDLQSLRACTKLVQVEKGFSFHLYGLNSPYRAHQRLEIGVGHIVPDLTLFINSHAWVGVGVEGLKIEGEHFVEMLLPSDFLRDKLPQRVRISRFFETKFLKIFYPDLFSGYDEEGLPLFQAYSEIRVGGHILYQATWPDKGKYFRKEEEVED